MQILGLCLILQFPYFTPLVTAGVTADLRDQNLKAVPTNLSTDLVDLKLARNFLNTLNADSFRNYSKLVYLDVSHNRLEVIEDRTFDQQLHLQRLSLDFNRIRQLPSYFGPSLTGLTSWHMYNGYEATGIFNLPYFANFTGLRTLHLGGVHMETFQDPTILPESLMNLDLQGKILPTVPDLSDTPNLDYLTLYSCSIEYIPQQNIDALTKLYYLGLGSNKLTSIPNLSHMSSLARLDLLNNLLQEVPRNHISGLVSLEWLSLRGNMLHIMPNISYLSKLTEVDLSLNDITEVPASTLSEIPNLLRLKLNNNKISVLGDISALWAHVYLHHNTLATLPDL